MSDQSDKEVVRPIVLRLDIMLLWLWIGLTAYDLSLWYQTGVVNGYEIAFDVAMIFVTLGSLRAFRDRERIEELEELENLLLKEDDGVFSDKLRNHVRQMKRDRR